MPELYEKIKREYIQKGKSVKQAKQIAAATYQNIRKEKPSLPKLSNKKGAK